LRLLEKQRWAGDKDVSTQALAWPRSGTGITDVEDDVVPQRVIDAQCELADMIADGTDVEGTTNTAEKVKRLKAGSVEIENFRGAEGAAVRFPTQVHELLRDYLASGAAGLVGVATGTDGVTVTDTDLTVNRGL
jgi:hypothetical protein